MWRIRELVAEAAGASGAARLVHSLQRGGRSSLRILAYHRILDIPSEADYPDDPELVSASVADFARQMAFVKRHFHPLRFADVVAALDAGERLPANSLVVTFDDGHVDNYTNAFPILEATGVPATIFLATDYIGADCAFWFDRVITLFHHAPRGTFKLHCASFEASLTDVASRRAAGHALVKLLKYSPMPKRSEILDELERLAGAGIPPELADRCHAMSWDQVREMAMAGIEFGSHSMSHQMLTMLTDACLSHELKESRRLIQVHTGQAAEVLGYPEGSTDAYDKRVVDCAKACGYRLGVSYRSGVNPADGLDRFGLIRLRVERYTSVARFRSMLFMPTVFD